MGRSCLKEPVANLMVPLLSIMTDHGARNHKTQAMTLRCFDMLIDGGVHIKSTARSPNLEFLVAQGILRDIEVEQEIVTAAH
jgi:hypothetical protein